MVMEHVAKSGDLKVVSECSLPTGHAIVDRIITDLAVIDVVDLYLALREIAERGNRRGLRVA